MTERSELGGASFAVQACELIETGQFELSVVAVQLHLAQHLRQRGAAAITEAITAVGGERLGQRLAAHLERWNAVTLRGEAITKDAAVDSIDAVTDACAALSAASQV